MASGLTHTQIETTAPSLSSSVVSHPSNIVSSPRNLDNCALCRSTTRRYDTVPTGDVKPAVAAAAAQNPRGVGHRGESWKESFARFQSHPFGPGQTVEIEQRQSIVRIEKAEDRGRLARGSGKWQRKSPNSCASSSQSSSPRRRLRTTRSSEAMEAEGATGVGQEREIGSFNWAGFFSNRYILLQILLYAYLFYTKLPGLDEFGPLLAWLLLLLPMCALNLIGTHKLKELAARRQRQD